MISADVLKWARESTALTIDQAARSAGLSPESLRLAEEGERRITFRQLRSLANTFRLPLRTMYLTQPPVEAALPVDYRSEHPDTAERSPDLIRAIRVARRRRATLIDLLSDGDQAVQVLPNPPNDNEIISVLTPLFCVPLLPDPERVPIDGAGALSFTKKLVEQSLPVAVFETSRSIDGVRGCSLYEPPLSIIILNSQDTPNARRFTLAHELAHLLMRESGICDPLADDSEIELRCNQIASEAMLPTPLLKARLDNPDDPEASIPSLAREFRISYSAVAFRLNQVNALSRERMFELFDLYNAQYRAQRERQVEAAGGPSFYLLQALRLGPKYTSAVLDAFSNGDLSTTQTAELLGVAQSHSAIDSLRERAAAAYER
jgi:Zn-dependent peptidase ImmA (M78 family)/transcriptional regulator with XRE-family HTH domain